MTNEVTHPCRHGDDSVLCLPCHKEAIEELRQRVSELTGSLQQIEDYARDAMNFPPRRSDENQDGQQTPAPSGHAGLGTAGGASSLHQPSLKQRMLDNAPGPCPFCGRTDSHTHSAGPLGMS